MFLCTALAGSIVSASGYLFRATRCVEDDLPDHDIETSPLSMQPIQAAPKEA
jgi:hypothetical protein